MSENMQNIKKFEVTIEEMHTKVFEVMADEDELEQMVVENYAKGIFALNPGTLVAKQMQVHNVTDDYWVDWIEF